MLAIEDEIFTYSDLDVKKQVNGSNKYVDLVAIKTAVAADYKDMGRTIQREMLSLRS
jgi:hypothetical protein